MNPFLFAFLVSLPWLPLGFLASYLTDRFSWRGRADRRLRALALARSERQIPLVVYTGADGRSYARPADPNWQCA
jgi:hypothetical protein